MNLARAGKLNYDIALDLTKSLAGEDDVIVIKAFQKAIEFLENMVSEDERYESFKTYVREGLQSLYEQVCNEKSQQEAFNYCILDYVELKTKMNLLIQYYNSINQATINLSLWFHTQTLKSISFA